MNSLLVTNGCVYPADEEDRVIPNGAVLAVDGRITAIGTVEEVGRAVAGLNPGVREQLRTVDASGHMVLPGLVNGHWHEMFGMRMMMGGATRPPSDREDVVDFMGGGGSMHRISRAFDSFDRLIDGMRPDEAEAIARYSMWTQLRSGVTTLGDVGSLNRPTSLVAAARSLGIRCVVGTWACDAICAPGETGFRRTKDTDAVLAGVEALIRECAGDDSGLIRCRPSVVYVTNMTDELGAGIARLVDDHELPFATHVGALRNEPELLRAYYGDTGVRRLADLGLVTERLTAVHTAFVDDEERSLLIEAGAHISFSPAKYGMTGETTITETRVVPELRRAGLGVSLSTDGMALAGPGMVEAMRAVWQSFNEMYGDQTEVLPSDALAMATRIGAAGLGWEDIGSLAPGKRADLVLVRTDDWRYLLNTRPLEAFLALGCSSDVDTVVVGGQLLVEGGRGVRVDEAELEKSYLEALSSFSTRCLRVPRSKVDRILTGVAR
ncbi:amidohydrolase family protein [Amycolatopsis sp. EV170708-02-1]|uniref:amidohydrolase family protein n=1 Tax=Amycolatopsis sp. EV170708-02-1 TaxID=2919322 RepID=UPI001F0C0827|nr:amidohydrolase family protein [Amycolatopsis sp. EV170708-02-1]UMP01316.1 amidohydrolase family protein [Amycolatopsis sp. EV170708-02-1]